MKTNLPIGNEILVSRCMFNLRIHFTMADLRLSKNYLLCILCDEHFVTRFFLKFYFNLYLVNKNIFK